MTQEQYDAAYKSLQWQCDMKYAEGDPTDATLVEEIEAWFERKVNALDKRFMAVTA
jgi:hypothetical protein